MRAHYRSAVAAMPATGEPKLVMFDWGGGIGASNGVVFDESDEVAWLPDRQSRAWQARARRTTLSCEGYSITPLGAHFCYAEFPC
jgi:hypothetical protein